MDQSKLAEYVDGELILDAFSQPPRDVVVVLDGFVDLWIDADAPEATDHADPDAPDVRVGPGHVFGLDATLTGKAIGPMAIAAGPVRAVRVPSGPVGALFADRPTPPARLAGSDAVGVAESPRYVAVDALMVTDLLVVPPTMGVAEAARAMNAHGGRGFAAMELSTGQLGVATDRMLRQRILAAELPAHTPVAEAAETNLPRAASGASAAEALIALMDTQADYVLVMGRDSRLRGVVDSRDFIVSSTTSGVSLHEQIRRAGSVEELHERALRVPALLAARWPVDSPPPRWSPSTRQSSTPSSAGCSAWSSTCTLHCPWTPSPGCPWAATAGARPPSASDIDSAAAFVEDLPQEEIDRYRQVFAQVTQEWEGLG